MIGQGQQGAGDLAHAVALMERHGALAAARDAASGWAEKARAALVAVPAHGLRAVLGDLADHVVSRIA